MIKGLKETFYSKYGEKPNMVVQSPGRVNIIGEHTDYNNGFVLPMAIDRHIKIAFRPRNDDKIKLQSIGFDNEINCSIHDDNYVGDWQDYVKSISWVLLKNNYELKGWEGVMTSNIPVGAGLSSSAALLLAILKVFSVTSNFNWDGLEMAKLARTAENDFLQLKSGIMDQMICALGRPEHAMLLDCRDLSSKFVTIPPNVKIIILDTLTRRELVDSKYNERVKQCEASAEYFGCNSLRDVDIETFEQKKTGLDELLIKRSKHVVYENHRVIEVSKAMKNNDVNKIGQLMNDSHYSLKNDYEVSSKELDIMVEIAQKEAGCFGARMTGAGFGGCAIALIDESFQEQFMRNIFNTYYLKTGIKPMVYICDPSSGAILS